jgi:hypothetical protein
MRPYANTHTWEPKTTTNDWEVLPDDWASRLLKTLTLVIENTGANSGDVRVLGSVDGGETYDLTLQSATTIASGEIVIVDVSRYITDVRIEAKTATLDAPTDIIARAAGIAV